MTGGRKMERIVKEYEDLKAALYKDGQRTVERFL